MNPISDLRAIAEEAGRIILRWYERPAGIVVTIKEDESPVTQADREADRLIARRLAEVDRSVAYVSEESLGAARGLRAPPERYWLVDPLDGTAEFLARNGEFCVAVAFVECGQVAKAVIHAPVLGLTYAGWRGGGVWRCRDDRATRVHVRAPADRPLCLVSRRHATDEAGKILTTLPGAAICPMGSALKFCRVAEGEADLYLRIGEAHAWDVAAGAMIVEEAGGAVIDATGVAPRFSSPLAPVPSILVVGDRGLLPRFAGHIGPSR